MLARLHIQNIALIVNCDIELSQGLNILSGETGAGKSIVIDSLAFVLGAKADRSLIRFNEKTACVEATFIDVSENVLRLLSEFGIDEEDNVVIINRKMQSDGKNDIRINGRSVTLSMLKQVGALLMDIVSQHENHSLLRPSTHIELLDSFAGENVEELKEKVAAQYAEMTQLKDRLSRFGNGSERARNIELLSFQVKEIEEADLKDGEYDELLNIRKKINNTERIVTAVAESQNLLDGEYQSTALANICDCIAHLKSVSTFDDALSAILDRLDSVKIEVEDISETINDIKATYDFDASYSESVETRIAFIRSLMRKYGSTIEDINAYYTKIAAELNELINADDEIDKLSIRLDKVTASLISNSKKLSILRQKSAKELEAKICTELSELGMGSAKFVIDFDNNDESQLYQMLSANGIDKVEFFISPNIGAPIMPLAKIASGGEMSRFMLAIKVITSSLDGINTMVFDEIDTGISGNIAQIVAIKMYKVSCDRQVIAVTHLPQICSMADNHYKIEKFSLDNTTKTSIIPLNEFESIKEIARLIGGSEYSEHSIPHATTMKKWANEFKLIK